MTGEDALFDLEPADTTDPGFAALLKQPLDELVAPDWADALRPVEGQLREALDYVAAQSANGAQVLPSAKNLLRAFKQPLADVKVLILGQDPYPTPGHAIGLSFAVSRPTRPIPRSLANIYRELHDDLGPPAPRPRRPQRLGGAGRPAPEPRPQRRSGKRRLPPRQRLGGSHDGGGHRRRQPH